MTNSTALAAAVHVKAALLQALMREDGYGLQLIDRIKQRTDNTLVLNQGTVYPALRALEKEGLVKSYEDKADDQRGGRPRVYYSLTSAGRRAALEQRETAFKVFGGEPAVAMG